MSSITIYKASAGSGKTYSLSLEYLKTLKDYGSSKDVSFLRKILAITFTNKAAFEMKDRIVLFLKDISAQNQRGKKLSELSGITPEQAENLLKQILVNYEDFQIKTIDSFLLNLYKAVAYELNLTSDFQIKEFLEDRVIEKVLESLFDRAEKEPQVYQFLEKFLEHLLTTEDRLKIDLTNKFFNFVRELVKVLTYHKEFVEVLRNKSYESYQDSSILMYLKFFSLLQEELEKLFYEEKLLFIGFWKEKLTKYLSDRETFLPWIYVKLGQIEAIIIDEFQDTDKLQWESITPLVEELVSRKGKLICAGDTKQSIFQWRGASPELLETISKVFAPYSPEEKPLSYNYRSFKNIVEFNNILFSTLLKDTELRKNLVSTLLFNQKKLPNYFDESEILGATLSRLDSFFSTVVQEPAREDIGCVKVEFLDVTELQSSKEQKKQLKKYLDEQVFEKVLSWIKEFSSEEVAVLLRYNEDIVKLSEYLISKGVRVVASAFLRLKESVLVSNLVEYLKLINYPEDEPALLAFLSSGFTEKGLEILRAYEGVRLSGGKLSLLDFVKSFYPEFWERWVVKFCEEKELSLYELLRRVIDVFNLKEKFQSEVAYLYDFLNEALKYTLKGASLSEFLTYWEEQGGGELDLPEEKNAVKVLSIHLAKGLEFDTVILPLFWEENPKGVDLGIYFYQGEVFKGRKDTFEKEKNVKGLSAWYLQKAKEKLELLNLLYVALTRPVKNLVVLSPVPALGKLKFEAAFMFNTLYEKAFKET